MRNAIYTVLVLALCSVLAGSATAQSPVTFDAGFAVFSNYVWRGYQVTDAASLQPAAQVKWPENGFAVSFFSNLAVQDRDVYEDLDKIELALSYERHLATGTPSWFQAGFLYHSFPRIDGDSNTTELFAAYGFDTPINPSLTLYYDMDLVKAWYINPAIAHSFPLGQSEQYALDVKFGLGFTDALLDNQGDEGFGLQNLDASASVGIAVGANAELRPTLAFSRSSEFVYADQNQFWGGASLHWKW